MIICHKDVMIFIIFLVHTRKLILLPIDEKTDHLKPNIITNNKTQKITPNLLSVFELNFKRIKRFVQLFIVCLNY